MNAPPAPQLPRVGAPAIPWRWCKVGLVAVLVLTLFLLQVCLLSLQSYKESLKPLEMIVTRPTDETTQSIKAGPRHNRDSKYTEVAPHDSVSSSGSSTNAKRTPQTSGTNRNPPMNDEDATLHQRKGTTGTTGTTAHTGASPPLAAHAHWNQVVASGWLDYYQGSSSDGGGDSKARESQRLYAAPTDVRTALWAAAEAGHAEAQVLVANALAAGYDTWSTTQYTASSRNGTVTDAWIVAPTSRDDSHHQHTQAMLYWHLAAVAGHVEAAQTLAHRHASSGHATCTWHLPYASAAAHAIVDAHLTNQGHDHSSGSSSSRHDSRGYVLPAKDKHVLYRVHVSSVLDPDSRPDEGTAETLQYFRVRANSLPLLDHMDTMDNETDKSWYPTLMRRIRSMQQAWRRRQTASDQGGGGGGVGSSDDASGSATQAAFTLARYYHYGIRGAPHDVPLAAHWYERAAHAGHWEAAGQAGHLYLYGIGVPRNVRTALAYFTKGGPAPALELQPCLGRYQAKLQSMQASLPETIFLCDDASLNGMGVLHVLGVDASDKEAMGVPVDLSKAMAYFELARNQGNADAAYNLAMMKLGWKTHFTPWDDLQPEGQSSNTVTAAELFPVSSHEADDTATQDQRRANSNAGSSRQTHPTVDEYKAILTDLATAASKSHLLARHRLAMLYESGIKIPIISPVKTAKVKSSAVSATPPSYQVVLTPDCNKAVLHYQWILDNASLTRAARMRRAYQQYIRGDTSDALRTYLLVAETGHDIAQMNAAFLMEQGECLGLHQHDCAKASVRLYKAVAAKGNAEASMRVGDFYYYGRFRTDRPNVVCGGGGVGPYRWMQYFIYPDIYVWPIVWEEIKRQIIAFSVWEPLSILDSAFSVQSSTTTQQQQENSAQVCTATDASGDVCSSDMPKPPPNASPPTDNDSPPSSPEYNSEDDLAMAAYYYQLAAERTSSPRAHYNLGFMYEWGLGLKQDFPLAKRQYDLAIEASLQTREAYVPVSLALIALNMHEYAVKTRMSWEKYLERRRTLRQTGSSAGAGGSSLPALDSGNIMSSRLAPLRNKANEPSNHSKHKPTATDIILSHLLSWESLLILVFTIVLSKLLQLRRTRR